MSPGQLLEKLENLGIIDEKILGKIRKEVENPEKKVKPKAVLNYLVKKKQITEKQAARLLKAPKPKPEDEMKVVQPVEKSYDTDDLTAINDEPAMDATPDASAVDPGATMMDDGKIADATTDEVIEVQPQVIASQAYDPVELDALPETDPEEPIATYDDGFDNGGLNGGYDSGNYQESKATVAKTFRGKRDQNDQWNTKWLYIGFGILGTLLIGVALTWVATMGQKPEDMYEAAMTAFNEQSWADANKKFEDFLDAFPNDKNAPAARARRIHSILRGTYGTKNWNEVIQQADTLLPELEEEGEKIELLRDDLAVMLPGAMVEITEKATKLTQLEAMEKELAVIEDYKETLDKPQYVTSTARKIASVAANIARVENNIKTVVGQIAKENRYDSDLVMIDKLGQENQTAAAFTAFQKLIRNYPDLRSRKPLAELMLQISKQESALVVSAEANFPVEANERRTLIQKTISLATRTGEAVDALKGEIVPFLADGAVYGIDAGEGKIAWRRFVGFSTNVQPQPIGEDFILIADQQNHELLLLQKDSGAIQWRAEIGESFVSPTIGDKIVVVTTKSGKVVQLNAANGAVEQSAQLPKQEERLGGTNIVANTSAMVATRDPYVYQVGYSDNLYIISTQDYLCKEVFYLGHTPGSIAVPPVAWQGYILVCVNRGDHCDLLILKGDKGRNLALVQTMSRITDGAITTPIKTFGSWKMLNSDNGQLKVLELSPNSEQTPIATFGPGLEVEANQPTFTLTEGSTIWVGDRAIARCKIKRNNNGTIDRSLILEPNDTFISPLQKLDNYVFHVRRRNQSGMISASLVDGTTLKPVWRTDIGGELAGPPTQYGDRLVAVSNQGDLFSIDQNAIQSGYSDSPVRASTVVENLKFQNTVRIDDETFACLGPPGRKDLLFAKGTTGQSKWNSLAPPADKPACPPIVIGKDLIVPSLAGFVARINPASGQLVGTPFQPEVRPNTKVPWFEPTLLKENVFAVAAGALEDGSGSAIYILSAENPSIIKELGSLKSDSPFRSRLVNDGNSIFAVIMKDERDTLTAISTSNPMAIQKEQRLGGALVAGPWLTDAGILVHLDDDKLYCFGTDLTAKWSIDMPNDKLACNPQTINSQLMLVFSSGKIALLNGTSGESVRNFAIGQPVIHKPFFDGQKIYIAGRDGTVHYVDLSQTQ